MWFADRTIAALRPLRFRGKGRLLDWTVPHDGTRYARVFGAKVELDLGDLIQRRVYLGTYEREETAMVSRYLRPGMTVVDAGANIGYFTLLAAARVGCAGRVFACEPSPYAAERLERTVCTNRLAHVRVLRVGLGADAGEVVLFTPSPGNHTPTMVGEVGAPGVRVVLRTLDECLTEWQLERVDLLKLDVEGYEPQVIAGAAAAVSGGRIRAVLCEFNDYWLCRAGTDAQSFYKTLLGLGFVDVQGVPPSFTGEVLTRLLRWRGGV